MSPARFLRLFAHIQLLPLLESQEGPLIGGQAVMEGVMMRAPHSYCVAVRRANGEIVTDQAPLEKLTDRYPFFKLPILRGLGVLGSAMSLGVKALRFSTDVAVAGDAPQDVAKKEVSSWAMALNLIGSLAFFIVLYKWVPLKLADLLGRAYPALQGHVWNTALDGIIRLAIFLGFLYLLSRFQDIHRVFEYHGAEHRVVFNYESGKPVTVRNAQQFTTLHPRCGTSFLLFVMVLSMVVYLFIPFSGFWLKFASRLVLLPLVAGLSYELLRFAARKPGSLLAIITTPGLWLQKITTQRPADDQTEVAIRALEGAMALEEKQGGQLVIA